MPSRSTGSALSIEAARELQLKLVELNYRGPQFARRIAAAALALSRLEPPAFTPEHRLLTAVFEALEQYETAQRRHRQ